MKSTDIITKKIISSRKYWCSINLFVSGLLLLLIEVEGVDTNNGLYLLYSLWLMSVYGWLSLSELRYPGLNIMSILFVGALMSMAYPSLSYSLDLLNRKQVFYGEYNISNFVFHTSVALNVYFSFFFLLITAFNKNILFIIDVHYITRRFNLFWVCIFIYILATFLRLVPFLEYISSILVMLADSLPMLVLLLLALYCGFNPVKDKYFKLFIVLMIAEIIYTMFFGFYKGSVIRAAFMYLLYYFIHCRTIGKPLISAQSIMMAFGFLFFILYIVYPFITLRRVETGFGANTIITELPKVDNMDILRRVLTLDYQMDLINDDGNSSALQDRLSSLGPSTFFYWDAYRNGHHTEMIRFSVQAMVPRFLAPKKQSGSAGAMAVSYARNGYFNPEENSAESIGLFASAYFWGGWPAAIIMCIITSFTVSLLLRTVFSHLENLFSWLIVFYLLFTFLMCFKETADGGYGMCIMYLIYTFIIYVTSLMFTKKKKRRLVVKSK